MSIRVLAVTALAAMAAAIPASATAQANDSLLVSTSWLAQRLNDPSIVIVHVGNASAYEEGHIPGARYLGFEAFTERHEPLYTELPEPTKLQQVLRAIGVSDDSRIVLYQPRGHPTIAARLFVTLDYLGHGDRASLLDGGLEKWRAEDRPLSRETPPVSTGSLSVQPRQDVVVGYEWMSEHFRDPSLSVLDARTSKFYTGSAGVTMHAHRPGHIPGAHNVPFVALTDEAGHFERLGVLREMFVGAGAVPGKRVVTYCHLGQQASLLYFVARYLGYDASMYDGSFEDWSRRVDAPVEGPHD